MSQKVSVKVNIGSTSTQPTPEPSPVKEPAPKKKFKLNGIQIGAICFVVLFAIICAVMSPITAAAGTLWALFRRSSPSASPSSRKKSIRPC